MSLDARQRCQRCGRSDQAPPAPSFLQWLFCIPTNPLPPAPDRDEEEIIQAMREVYKNPGGAARNGPPNPESPTPARGKFSEKIKVL